MMARKDAARENKIVYGPVPGEELLSPKQRRELRMARIQQAQEVSGGRFLKFVSRTGLNPQIAV